MRSGTDKQGDERRRPHRLLLWSLVAALVFWGLQVGQPLEDALRTARNASHPSKASGKIVFVGIDDKSLQKIGSWPWPRSTQAKLIDRATAAGAKSIHLDLIYDSPSRPDEDRALSSAIGRSGRVVLADRQAVGSDKALKTQLTRPLPIFADHASTASATTLYDYYNAVRSNHVSVEVEGQRMSTFAGSLAHRAKNDTRSFWIDYSIQPASVPYVSAADLLSGRTARSAVEGKDLIIGLNADQLGDQFWLPGYGRAAGAYVHVLGAETLLRGTPRALGGLPAIVLAALLAWFATSRRDRWSLFSLAGGVAVLLFAPLFLEQAYVSIDIVPALAMLLIVGWRLALMRWKERSQVNELTGLPTFATLRSNRLIDQPLVLAKIHNHAEISSALPEAEQKEAYRQIVARLSTGHQDTIYQGDDGTFAWTVPTTAPIGNHLEALHSLFRSPVQVAGRQIDIALSFGAELGSTRSLGNRIGSAVLAADEAWIEGLRWKLHDPARQEEVNWRVSLLGELDQAIDQGEVWLAYQPQYDIQRGRIVGAEALARWTHPHKGPISPAEFVAAAENNGRIAKLTDFVLDRAIGSAAAINKRGVSFQVAVNLSARLLSDRELLSRIRAMLDTHGLAPDKLTLELTETATLQDAESGLATLDELRRLGIRVAIDDYGTGLSTLDYLKKIPANEIKIDQSFVKSMRVNRSDLIMVQSTIALAHSLGRTVVAEGVEDKQCLDELTRMGCDLAQGFAIGRPMGVRELIQRLQVRSARRVA
ncbi:EAL domain-containing protein [Sphingomonas astaxanthinifaciens]|uniref:EAL domain-containing protein n=1 Tax=Sphingomonas astaxanthinifaciens DSM 22298 TaxID=1123267 RepID=A0ABQ5Z889_9SPHN|nr:EAL domain-containing protein [Sphingomonas astaxanthinifaciens]GLR47686.1 hypothetical protein GCM10007925_13990 [Sphingomonas astaxanthinifaciens DSM 22298]